MSNLLCVIASGSEAIQCKENTFANEWIATKRLAFLAMTVEVHHV